MLQFITRSSVIAFAAAMIALAIAGSATAHDESEQVAEASKPMSVTLKVKQAPGGLLLHVMPKGFRWAPEHLSPVHGSGKVVQGRGHGHVYVNGAKKPAALLVGPWTYLSLPEGVQKLRIELNTDTHIPWARKGNKVDTTKTVTVAAPMPMS